MIHGQVSTGLEEGLEGHLPHLAARDLAARGLAAHGQGSSLASGRFASEIPLGELLVCPPPPKSVARTGLASKRLEGRFCERVSISSLLLCLQHGLQSVCVKRPVGGQNYHNSY